MPEMEGKKAGPGSRRRFLAALLLGSLALVWGGAQKEEQAEVLFQAGLHKELAEGDLQGAIKLYQRIVASHAGNRAVEAKALLRMGHCYQKLGRAEARQAYERVLRDYADQVEQAAEARGRLAALGPPSGARSQRTLQARRVWEAPEANIVVGSVSPDGRYLTYLDRRTGNLALRDLSTGVARNLTADARAGSLEYAQESLVSPDGRQVAYAWIRGYLYDLRLARLEGRLEGGLQAPQPRVLYHDPEVEYLEPGAWSPDGRYLCLSLAKADRTNQIALFSIADRSLRMLKTVDWRHPHVAAYSPEGRHLVYDFPPQQESSQRDIFLLAVDGSRQTALVEHPANDRVLGWTPDGRGILFQSDRGGSMGLWFLAVSEGKPRGGPELVKPDIGQIVSLGFSRAGAFYYGVEASTRDAYIATLEKSGKLISPPERVSQRFVGSNQLPAFSPDGKSLAYHSRRGAIGAGLGFTTLVIRSVEDGAERELSPRFVFLPEFSPLRWCPDGRWIAAGGQDQTGRSGLYRIEAQTGEVRPIVQCDPADRTIFPAWSPDGKLVFYLREDRTSETALVVRELETGREKDLYRAVEPSFVSHFALSPDGRRLVFHAGDRATAGVLDVLKVMPAEGGEARVLMRAPVPKGRNIARETGLAWTPDGAYVLFGRWRGLGPGDRTVELWRVPATGGAPEKLGLAMWEIVGLNLHPDGQRLAFTGGQLKQEVWVLENFLAGLGAAR